MIAASRPTLLRRRPTTTQATGGRKVDPVVNAPLVGSDKLAAEPKKETPLAALAVGAVLLAAVLS